MAMEAVTTSSQPAISTITTDASAAPSIVPTPAAASTSSRCPLLGSDFADVYLFSSTTNTAQLVSLFNRHKLHASLINPHLLPSSLPLLAALTKTARQQQSSSPLSAQSAHHQLLFNLSPSTHIQTAVARFTPESHQTDVLLVTINQHDTHALLAQVKGVRCAVEREEGGLDGALRRLCDVEAVKKLYKVTEAELTLGGGDAHEALQQAVTCRIAIK